MPNTQRPGGKGFRLPTGSDPQSVRQRVEAMEMLLERSFRIPGINYPVGLDAIVGLVPILGDVVTAAMGPYALWEALNLGLPKWNQWLLAANLLFDTATGAITLGGEGVGV